MKRIIICLSIAVLLTLGLATGLWFDGYEFRNSIGEAHIDISAEQIDSLELGRDGNSLVLQSHGNCWSLPEYFDLLADQSKIDNLLSYLNREDAELKNTSEEEWNQLKENDDKLDCRVVFKGGREDLATILFYAPSDSRNSYGLLRSDDGFFVLPSSPLLYGLDPSDWIDKQLLHFNPKEIQAIEFQGFRLTRKNGQLTLADLEKNEKVSNKELQRLIESVTHLSIVGVSPVPGRPYGEERIQEVWIDFKNKPVQYYVFYRNEGQDYDLLMTSEYQCQFIIDRSLSEIFQKGRPALITERG
jgi:hypothetical protein